MIIRFLLSRLGLSIIAALVIISVAIGYKYKTDNAPKKSPTALVVEKIITDALQNVNQLEQSGALTASSSIADVVASSTNASSVPTTATDRFSQELFREYIAAKQSGQEITPDLSSQIAEKVLSQDYSDPLISYSASDMKVMANPTLSQAESYGNSLGSILSAPSAAPESELFIFEKITNGASVADYQKELLAIRKRYQTMKTRLLALPVPSSIASAQASIATSLSTFTGAIDAILALDTDPIGALNKIAAYDNGVASLTQGVADIKAYFQKEKVSFSSTELGYILMN